MSTELAKRETLISNIGFFETKFKQPLTSVAVLQRYSLEALQEFHDNLAKKFQGSEFDKTNGGAKMVAEKILKEIEDIKKLDEPDELDFYNKRRNLVIDLAMFFEDELREAGYEPAILEAFETIR